MSIKRMLLLASMALAAIAFAAPAAAQANITLTDEGGKKVKNKVQFTATSTNLQTHLSENRTLSCAHVALDLEVLNEGPQHLVVQNYKEATTAGCGLETEQGTFPATISDGTFEQLTLNTWGHGTANATFTSTIFGDAGHTMPIGHCHFEGKVTVQATTNNKLDVHGTLAKTPEEASCPSETGTITGEFDLKTHNGEPITINFTHTE